MPVTSVDGKRLRERFETFSSIGETAAGGVNRPALSAANAEARDRLVAWFEDAGLEVTVDTMGNIFGRRGGTDPTAPPVLCGSHIDSQYNGGRYDGVVGVLGALEILEALEDGDVATTHPIEVVAWSNEEGVRFQPDMLGSGVFSGVFDRAWALDRTDDDGVRFGDALEEIGYVGERACEAGDLAAYFELHVEQGPVLEERAIPVAAVSGVYGFSWLEVTFEGQANHAGPTPMGMRSDAFVGTASVATRVREIATQGTTDLVGTVGSVDVWPDAINVIPERATFTVDLRAPSDAVVDDAVEDVREYVAEVAATEGLDATVEEIVRVEADTFDERCVGLVEDAAEAIDCQYTTVRSGAGHDANYLNRVAPTAMVFVPSVNGISHRESEFTEWADVVTGTKVLAYAVAAAARGETLLDENG
jgi:N-carbamoyl-L-amino-acid hydrolase